MSVPASSLDTATDWPQPTSSLAAFELESAAGARGIRDVSESSPISNSVQFPSTTTTTPTPSDRPIVNNNQAKRVQWPASNDGVASKHDSDPLTPAKPGHHAVSIEASEAGSLANDADLKAQKLTELRAQLGVFVAPGEVDGLPSTYGSGNEKLRHGMEVETENKAELPTGIDIASNMRAKKLIGNFTSGNSGFLHRRKGFKAGRGLGEVPSGVNEVDLIGRATPIAASEGILSSLIALNQPSGLSGSATPSPGHSAINTPLSSRPASPAASDLEDEDEEKERFLAKLRARRASKNALQHTSAAVVSASKSVAGAAITLATHGSLRPPRKSTSTSNLVNESHIDDDDAATLHRPSLSLENQSHSTSALTPSLSTLTQSKRSKSGSSLVHLIEKEYSRSHLPSPSLTPSLPASRSPQALIGQSFRRVSEHLGLAGEVESLRSVPSNLDLAGASKSHLAPLSAQSRHRHSSSLGDIPRFSQTLVSGDASPKLAELSDRASFDAATPVQHEEQRSYKIEEDAEEADEAPLSMAMSMKKRARKNNATGMFLKDMPSPPLKAFNPFLTPGSRAGSPSPSPRKGYFHTEKSATLVETEEEREQREWEKEKRRRRKIKEKERQRRIVITQHVAAILSRQDFLMKLARGFMMFGAPTHRLEAQFQATAKILEVNAQSVLLPGVMLISFGDSGTHTSEVKFIKQPNGLDLGKLAASFSTYQKVIRDVISVTDASVELDELLIAPPKYRLWQHLLIGGLASAAIGPSAFYASFVDVIVSIPLGALLVAVQVLVSRNDLYSSLFEIAIACLNAFLAAAFASTRQICFTAVASSSVVLILPGYIVLCGSLELANRSMISGSVRMVYSVLYSLFLGFGLSLGNEFYKRLRGRGVEGAGDYTCAALRIDAPWWRATIPQWYYFISIPTFLLMLGLRNGQPFFRRTTLVMLLIGSAGFCTNFFSSRVFVNRSDISSALGSLAVGLLANLWAKLTGDSAFIVSVVGVFVQLPSGLANGGLLRFANEGSEGQSSYYISGFEAAESLVQIAIGLTVGLFVATALTNMLGGGRRRGSSLHSF